MGSSEGAKSYDLRIHGFTACGSGASRLSLLRAAAAGAILRTRAMEFCKFCFFAILIALTKPMGAYMAKVFGGERTLMHRSCAGGGRDLQVLRHR